MTAKPPPRKPEWDVYLLVALGGAAGGLARWAVGTLLPARTGVFPWGTFLINATGCLLLGVLMVFVQQVWRPGRYARPFLGVGVLGGYTTFSTYAADTRSLLAARSFPAATAYALGSLAAGLAAVALGVILTRWATGRVGQRTRRLSQENP